MFLAALLSFAASISAAGPSRWRIEDGWLLRSCDDGAGYKRFLAVAIWGVPGWQGGADADVQVQEKLYETLDCFEVVHVRAKDLEGIDSYLPDKYRDTVFMVGLTALNWGLRSRDRSGNYVCEAPLSFEPRTGRPDYAGSLAIRADLRGRRLFPELG